MCVSVFCTQLCLCMKVSTMTVTTESPRCSESTWGMKRNAFGDFCVNSWELQLLFEQWFNCSFLWVKNFLLCCSVMWRRYGFHTPVAFINISTDEELLCFCLNVISLVWLRAAAVAAGTEHPSELQITCTTWTLSWCTSCSNSCTCLSFLCQQR